MLQSRRRLRRSHAVDAEIRLTNLIDVAFVLLIIFMITAPILQGGIEVQLPKADAAAIEGSDAVVITVEANGNLSVNKTAVTLDAMPDMVKAYARGGMPVTLNGDGRAQYEHVARALGRLYRAGITDVNLVVDPETRR